MIASWNKRIEIGEKELANPNYDQQKKSLIADRIQSLKQGVELMRRQAFLISSYDPYIALPSFILQNTNDPFAPKVGDYAVVIHNNKIYPCIVGDKSQNSSVGEASARLAVELNPEWENGMKVISSPSVGYIVFPNSADVPASTPDYSRWAQRCRELLNEIGGIATEYEFHEWKNLFPPRPSFRPK